MHRTTDIFASPSKASSAIFSARFAGSSLLVYPCRNKTGVIEVFDVQKGDSVSTIAAHDSAVVALAFNSDGQFNIRTIIYLCGIGVRRPHSVCAEDVEHVFSGNLLASASEKGTVIRVFSMPSGERLHELQRGLLRAANINSLAFCVKSKLLACVSDKEVT